VPFDRAEPELWALVRKELTESFKENFIVKTARGGRRDRSDLVARPADAIRSWYPVSLTFASSRPCRRLCRYNPIATSPTSRFRARPACS